MKVLFKFRERLTDWLTVNEDKCAHFEQNKTEHNLFPAITMAFILKIKLKSIINVAHYET